MIALFLRVSLSVLIFLLTGQASRAATHTLTINTNGSGTVSRNPTNSAYPEGAVVTITALPASGWQFGSWSGDATGTNNPLNVTMNADKVIIANFGSIPDYNLVANVSGNGSVSPMGGVFPSNTTVSVTATPSNGWVFHHWSGDVSGNANPLALTMNGNKMLTATFVQPPAIVSQPTGAVLNAGDTTAFTVGATGSAPLSYQWLFSGSVLAGAVSATLTFTNVQSSEAGDYRAVATNPYGSATSQVATLAVNCPGTNVVTVCTDTALRQAVATGGHVRFCCNGTIVLTNTIDIARDVTLDASGRSVVVSGNHSVRLFNVSTGVSFTASNLALADGLRLGTNGADAVGVASAQDGESAAGGAIYNSGGFVRLVSCVLSNNQAQGGQGGSGNAQATSNGNGGNAAGGGIYNLAGTVILQNVLGLNNTARGATGGIYTVQFGGPGYGNGGSATGGAIHNNAGVVSLGGSLFFRNEAYAVAGSFSSRPVASGGALFQSSGSCELIDSTFSSNRAVGASAAGFGTFAFNHAANARGGAVAATGGVAVIRHVGFRLNMSVGGNSFRFSGVGEAFGGAVFNSAEMTMSEADLTGNTAQAGAGGGGRGPASGWGGAIFNAAALEVTRSTLAANAVYGSAGYCVGTPTGSAGTAAYGGALCNIPGATFRSTNCTFTMNRAVGGWPCSPGVSAGGAYGGGIYNEGALLTLVNVTVASNDVSVTPNSFQGGPAAGANVANTNGSLVLQNSLLAYPGTNANVWGAATDGGFNISSDESANFNSGSSFNFTDPKLAPLANNGGPTLTMALLPDSPAIDFGTISGAPATDQRGQTRPYGNGTDMGAFEAGPAVPPLLEQRSGVMLNISFIGQAGVSYRIERSANLSHWETEENTGVLSTNGVVSKSYPMIQPLRFYRLTLDL